MIKKIIQTAKNENRNFYEHEAFSLLAGCGITVPRHAFGADKDSILKSSNKIGYPLVLKIVSRDILHKSDVGGVVTGITSFAQLAAEYDGMMKNINARIADAKIEGVLIMEQAKPGIECIAGMVRDEQFGPAVMFGSGGVLVELLDDVAFALPPLSRVEALRMIGETKAGKLLAGYRGIKTGNIEAMADLLIRLGNLAEDCPEIKEIDLNPVFAYENGILPVDARIIIS